MRLTAEDYNFYVFAAERALQPSCVAQAER